MPIWPRRSRGNPKIGKIALPFLLLLALASSNTAKADDTLWRRAEPGYEWSFPRDHWGHPEYKTEWWYFTGHLAEAEGEEPRYGFQFTFFRAGLLPETPVLDSAWAASDLIMGHASVTDVATGEHVFSEILYRAVPLLGGFGAYPDPVLAWSRAPAGTDDRWSLIWTGEGFHLRAHDARRGLFIDLEAVPEKPVVLQGSGGYSRKSGEDEAAASLYYSITRLRARGRVGDPETPTPVIGSCWMDREIFTSTLAVGQIGWDWLSLQLDDGRELMLYRLRDAAGEADFGLGALVEADGRVRRLRAEQWQWTPGDVWRSPETGAEYPVSWRLRVPAAGLDLELSARVEAQENVSQRSGVRYWEGAIVAEPSVGGVPAPDGSAGPRGLGYIELTGYGEGARPRI